MPKHHTKLLAELLIGAGPDHGHDAWTHAVHKVNWTDEAKFKKQAECQPNIQSAGDGNVGCLLAPPFSCHVANSTSSRYILNASLNWGARNYHSFWNKFCGGSETMSCRMLPSDARSWGSVSPFLTRAAIG